MKSGQVDLKRSPGAIGVEEAVEQENWESFVIVLGAALSDVTSAQYWVLIHKIQLKRGTVRLKFRKGGLRKNCHPSNKELGYFSPAFPYVQVHNK